MQAQATSAAVCPECGTRLEGAFSRNLGRCMICLLRVGFDDAEEPDEKLFAPITDRLGNYRIERRDDGTAWELGHGHGRHISRDRYVIAASGRTQADRFGMGE